MWLLELRAARDGVADDVTDGMADGVATDQTDGRSSRGGLFLPPPDTHSRLDGWTMDAVERGSASQLVLGRGGAHWRRACGATARRAARPPSGCRQDTLRRRSSGSLRGVRPMTAWPSSSPPPISMHNGVGDRGTRGRSGREHACNGDERP